MSLIKLVKDKNRQNRSLNITSIGLPGAGKSYGNINILQQLTGIEDEEIVKYIYFNGEKYLKDLQRPCSEFETLNLDDAGFIYAARDWYSNENIQFIKRLQVARRDKKNVMASVPHPKLVDGGLGLISHVLIAMDYWGSGTTGKGKMWRHDIDMNESGAKDRWYSLGRVEFSQLDPDVAAAYEEKKNMELDIEDDTELSKEAQYLGKILHYFKKLNYDDLEAMLSNRNGDRKPFGAKQLAPILKMHPRAVARLIDRMTRL